MHHVEELKAIRVKPVETVKTWCSSQVISRHYLGITMIVLVISSVTREWQLLTSFIARQRAYDTFLTRTVFADASCGSFASDPQSNLPVRIARHVVVNSDETSAHAPV